MFRGFDYKNDMKPHSKFVKDFIHHKFAKKIKEINLRKINLYIGLGVLGGIPFIKAILRRI
jgi:hypothetical protein